MFTQTEGKYAGEWVASEAGGERSRDVLTLNQGQNLVSGTILGTITASGKVAQVSLAAADGSQSATGILYDNVNATGGDTPAVVFTADAEFNDAEVVYPAGATPAQIAAINTQLAAVGLKARKGL